jgi:hypothetical protein
VITNELMTWPAIVRGAHAATRPLEYATLAEIARLGQPHPTERTPVRLHDLLPARDTRAQITAWLASDAGQRFLESADGRAHQARELAGCPLFQGML